MVNNIINNPLFMNGFFFMVVELNLANEYGIFVPDADVTTINHFLGKLLKMVD
ncbi:hypothetical protein SAMN06298215_0767 [Bacteroidales bacterium WCE2008]|nr:hypothetical protein SAMN06298215_0767 [Bacteroidales bacterium WCE2008]